MVNDLRLSSLSSVKCNVTEKCSYSAKIKWNSPKWKTEMTAFTFVKLQSYKARTPSLPEKGLSDILIPYWLTYYDWNYHLCIVKNRKWFIGLNTFIMSRQRQSPYQTRTVHSVWCIRDVWFGRLEVSLIFFRIVIVFIPYFPPKNTHLVYILPYFPKD